MPRRNKGKGKAGEVSTTPRDQPPVEGDDAGPLSPGNSPAAALVKPDLTIGEVHMDTVGLLHPVVHAEPHGGTSVVSTTVINIPPARSERPRVASANRFEALETLADLPVEDWAEEVATASGRPIHVTKSSTEGLPAGSHSAQLSTSTSPQPVKLAPSEIRELRKTQRVLLVGERGRFTWHVAQGLLKTIATKYQEDPSLPFPSGLALEFPQTPSRVLKYVEQFIRKGGFDASHSGAAIYPGSDARALLHLHDVARELGIMDLEARASRDIALVQDFLTRHSIWVEANRRKTAATENPELFIVIAEYDEKLYKVHCRKRAIEKRGRQVTKGTLHCVGVIRHFVEYDMPRGPFDLIAHDRDGLWAVTCGADRLKKDFVFKKDQEVVGHLDLVQMAD